jgi:hypothetical protein
MLTRISCRMLMTLIVVLSWNVGPATAEDFMVSGPSRRDTSPTLRAMPVLPPSAPPNALQRRLLRVPSSHLSKGPLTVDPVLQTVRGLSFTPATSGNFEGIASAEQSSSVGWVIPPDTNGAIGPTHYVQIVNITFAIYRRDGTRIYGPAGINTLWQGFGATCGVSNDGDPTVLYDHLADRWVVSQLAIPNFPNGPFYQCIAVSASGDPLGAWHRYEYVISNTKLNDYPKFGLWPDGYYLSANQFDNCVDQLPPFGFITCDWAGPRAVVFERAKMLDGQLARMVAFEKSPANLGGLLPSSLDGPPPPVGTPNYFTQVDDGAWFTPAVADRLQIWPFHVDWGADPPAASFGPSQATDPDVSSIVLPTAPFDSNMCGYQPNCIPQPGTDIFGFPSPAVDALSDRLMHRLQYRVFPTHESIVATHTVNAGNQRAGLRWYELRKDTAGEWGVYQQGTYAPNDGNHRWMGSIAMDQTGNIALGYSLSSLTTWPSIRYVVRAGGDPLGELGQEATIVQGSGAQLDSSGRWGDYSAMSVDPTDDCTFWYTQEYYHDLEYFYGRNWQTRIASFRLPSCGTGPVPSISISDTTVAEGNAGTVNAVFPVTLSAPSDQTITVAYATADGSATAGVDYVAASGIVDIPPGATGATITVAVISDTVPEATEAFFVNLSNPTNATLANMQARGTIVDDDVSPGSITVLSPNGGENWRVGQNKRIKWTSTGVVGSIRIDLARDGVSYTETIAGSTVNDGVDSWVVTGPATNSARIRICSVDLSVCDASNAVFKIR